MTSDKGNRRQALVQAHFQDVLSAVAQSTYCRRSFGIWMPKVKEGDSR